MAEVPLLWNGRAVDEGHFPRGVGSSQVSWHKAMGALVKLGHGCFVGIHTSKRQTDGMGLQMQVLLLVGGENHLLSSKICTAQLLNCYSLFRSKNPRGIALRVTEATCQKTLNCML